MTANARARAQRVLHHRKARVADRGLLPAAKKPHVHADQQRNDREQVQRLRPQEFHGRVPDGWAARRRQADKRGHDAVFVTFDDAIEVAAASTSDDLLALDRALTELSRLNPRQATLVESRFFGGLDVAELTTLLGVSEATVLRDWRAARAWLAAELGA